MLLCSNPACGCSVSLAEGRDVRGGICPGCGSALSSGGSGPGIAAPPHGATLVETDPLPPSLSSHAIFDGRYRIEGLVGAGGMGVVYRAYDLKLERPVALKIPHLDHNTAPDLVKRFHREARIAASFDHPNLCQVYDFSEVGGVQYLTMPFIEGRPLSTLLEAGPLAPRRAAEIIATLALALAEAHRCGVIHRDLKPANIMITSQGKLVIMDFGIARIANPTDSLHTSTGAMMGTPAYMSPEQVQGDPDAIGCWTDVYCLGVIFYHLLTGQMPFQGGAHWVCVQVVNDPPRPPSELRPHLDPRLEAICLKAMAKKPEQRYASMEEMAWALEQALKQSDPGALANAESTGLSPGLEQALATLLAKAGSPPAAARTNRTPSQPRLPGPSHVSDAAALNVVSSADDVPSEPGENVLRLPLAPGLARRSRRLIVVGALVLVLSVGLLRLRSLSVRDQPRVQAHQAAARDLGGPVSGPGPTALLIPRRIARVRAAPPPAPAAVAPVVKAEATPEPRHAEAGDPPAEPGGAAGRNAVAEPSAHDVPAELAEDPKPERQLTRLRGELLDGYQQAEQTGRADTIAALWRQLHALQERLQEPTATIILKVKKSKSNLPLLVHYDERDEKRKTLKLYPGAVALLALAPPVTLTYALVPSSGAREPRPSAGSPAVAAGGLPAAVPPPGPEGLPPPVPGMPPPVPGMPPLYPPPPMASPYDRPGNRPVPVRHVEVSLHERVIEFSLVGGKWQHHSLPPSIAPPPRQAGDPRSD